MTNNDISIILSESYIYFNDSKGVSFQDNDTVESLMAILHKL